MGRLYRIWMDAAVAAVVLIPVFWALHKRRWTDPWQAVHYLLFAIYLCGVYAAAGLPGVHRLTFLPRVNVDFFLYMFSDYRSSLLNVVFFLPLGFFLPMLWRRFRRMHRTVLFGFGTSLFIELAQLLTPRATDVNDLITNTAGTILGYILAMLAQWIVPSLIPENNSRDVYRICGIVVATMFFVHPLIVLILR